MNISLKSLIVPGVILLLALAIRCAWSIWDALRGHGLESELRL